MGVHFQRTLNRLNFAGIVLTLLASGGLVIEGAFAIFDFPGTSHRADLGMLAGAIFMTGGMVTAATMTWYVAAELIIAYNNDRIMLKREELLDSEE